MTARAAVPQAYEALWSAMTCRSPRAPAPADRSRGEHDVEDDVYRDAVVHRVEKRPLLGLRGLVDEIDVVLGTSRDPLPVLHAVTGQYMR